MAELPEKDFASKVQADTASVAEAARQLLPDLDDPEFRAYLVAKMDLWGQVARLLGEPAPAGEPDRGHL